MKSLRVQCENDDCSWQGELRSLVEHIDNCEYTMVDCPNGCEVEQLVKKDLDVHLESECLKRDYECPYCEEEGVYDEMITTHLEECPYVEIECPNLGCEKEIPRCEISIHQFYCDYEPVSCKYAEVGCEEKLLRKDIKKHEEDVQLHFQMTLEKVLELNKLVVKLDSQLQAKNQQITILAMKIHNSFKFKVRRFQFRREFQSPSFYSSHDGYKMCVKMSKKDSGDGTHVSVYTYLLKGDNDNYLTWPFTGTITIELLNQLEDKNHHKMIVPFKAEHVASKRVVDGETAPHGRGRSKFISHTDLDYQPDKNCQYLKDDRLVFRVSIQVPDNKPWLECVT